MKSGVKQIGQLKLTKAQKKFALEMPKLMEIMAEESLNHYLQGFRNNGGQTDKSRSGWKQRKENKYVTSYNPNTKKFNYGTANGRNILTKTGALKNDLKVLRNAMGRIVIGTRRIPYAATHNEGLQIPERKPVRRKALMFAVGGQGVFRKSAKGFKMPVREFLGDSKELDKKNKNLIVEIMNDVLKAK